MTRRQPALLGADLQAGNPSDRLPAAPPKSPVGHILRGCSIQHIASAMMAEVKAAGLTPDATIYEIEEPVILPKGADVHCPRDGQKGAAYVDAIHGRANSGVANFMLSYSWGNSIGDIADALMQHCRSHHLDPRTTYVWICCLCVNQHRVRAAVQRGEVVPFDEFQRVFAERVKGIGSVVALMTPWRRPTYVTRVWCNFEMFTAISLGKETCNVSITMPSREADDLRQSMLEGSSFDDMWKALGALRIQEANASVAEDKRRIFQIIQEGQGFHSLNSTVSTYLQAWFVRCCEAFMEKRVSEPGVSDEEVAILHCQVGRLLLRVRRSDMLERAQADFARSREIRERNDTLHTLEGVMLLRDIGTAHGLRGEPMSAFEVYSEARQILQGLGALVTPQGAKLLSSMGMTKSSMGDMEGALEEYREAQSIQQRVGMLETPDGAGLLTGIGLVLSNQGNKREALKALRQAREIRIRTGTLESPDGAGLLGCLGNVMRLSGDREGALSIFKEARELYEQLGMLDTPGGALLLRYVGVTRMEMGELDGAMDVFTRAKGILESTPSGMDTSIAAKLLIDFGLMQLRLGYEEQMFDTFVEAHRLHNRLGLLPAAPRLRELARKPQITSQALARWREHREVFDTSFQEAPESPPGICKRTSNFRLQSEKLMSMPSRWMEATPAAQSPERRTEPSFNMRSSLTAAVRKIKQLKHRGGEMRRATTGVASRPLVLQSTSNWLLEEPVRVHSSV